jgi:hypothetical protein
MKPRYLIAGAALVALLLVGLLWMMRHHEPPPTSASVSPPAQEALRVVPTPSAAPAPPTSTSAPVTEAPPAEPILDRDVPDPNRIVHDHSGQPNNAKKSPLAPDTIFAVRQAVTPAVKSCAEPLARSGVKGGVTVVAKVTIAGSKVTTSEPTVKHPDFKDASFDDCVTKAFAQLSLAAPGSQTDAVYKLALPFDVL